MDNQTVNTTKSGDSYGYDAGRTTKGRNRHTVIVTNGNLLTLTSNTADVQKRDRVQGDIVKTYESFPTPEHIVADSEMP